MSGTPRLYFCSHVTGTKPGHEYGVIVRKEGPEFRGEPGTAFVCSDANNAVAVSAPLLLTGHLKRCRMGPKDEGMSPGTGYFPGPSCFIM